MHDDQKSNVITLRHTHHGIQDPKGEWLPFEVLQSAAGYYIGTKYIDPDTGYLTHYSRESQEYYRTAKDAHEALAKDTFTKRMNY